MLNKTLRHVMRDVWTRIQYKKLKLQVYLVYNFGPGEKGCTQFFDLRLVPKASFRAEADVAKYFHAYWIWHLGPYYLVRDTRDDWERIAAGAGRASGNFNPDDLRLD